MLYDNHHRHINYLRLAVTDRCNLRCFYCMPEEGIQYLPKPELMTYEEMLSIVGLMVEMGIEKVRITGGEPFVRRDMLHFLGDLAAIPGLRTINLTTNGTLTAPLVPELKALGIASVNLSLDTLDRARFLHITRRDALPAVLDTLEALLAHAIPTKINAVVMDGQNIEDLLPLAELTRTHPVSVRFIEEMPFNGEGSHYPVLHWNHQRILAYLQNHYPQLEKKTDPPATTAYHYQVPGYVGDLGIIAAYSRTFCGTCNRLRLTPQGLLKTCLYDDGVFNIKNLMRAGASRDQLRTTLLEALGNRARDGWEAEKNRTFGQPVQESMSTIGG